MERKLLRCKPGTVYRCRTEVTMKNSILGIKRRFRRDSKLDYMIWMVEYKIHSTIAF